MPEFLLKALSKSAAVTQHVCKRLLFECSRIKTDSYIWLYSAKQRKTCVHGRKK